MQLSPAARTARRERLDDSSIALNELRRIVRAVRTFSHSTGRTLGISGAQLYLLQAIAAEPAISLKELSLRTHTDPSSVSVVASRLVDRGLVVRRASRTDARRAELSIAASGTKLIGRAPEALQARLVAGLDALSANDRRVLARSLSRLVIAIGADMEKPTMFFEPEGSNRSTSRQPARATKRSRRHPLSRRGS